MLSDIIPPEIINSPFYDELLKLGKDESLKTYLEIGSSSGAGSTHALVSGIKSRSDISDVQLFCMEVSTERFNALSSAYKNENFVRCYNLSSITIPEFPTEEEVRFFYNNTSTNLNHYPIEQVLGWMQQDIEYLLPYDQTRNGIDKIKEENSLTVFDFVLIDGSEFTGERELYKIMGSKVIALDDVNAHKTFNCYRTLKNHVAYEPIVQELSTRNGYAIFKKRF